jgi:hypothetical protein
VAFLGSRDVDPFSLAGVTVMARAIRKIVFVGTRVRGLLVAARS